EQIGGVYRRHVHGRDRAVAHQDGGDAVAYRLLQPGTDEHLGVVVGVGVDEAGHHPAVLCIDHLGIRPDGKIVGGDGGDDAVTDTEIADDSGCAGAVEPEAAANDDIEIPTCDFVIHATHGARVTRDRGHTLSKLPP